MTKTPKAAATYFTALVLPVGAALLCGMTTGTTSLAVLLPVVMGAAPPSVSVATGTIAMSVSYTHLTLPTIYSV